MATFCIYPSQHHGLPLCKFVLHYFEKSPGIIITHQETNKYATNTCSKTRFHFYRNVSGCTAHGIFPYEERKIFSMCSSDISSLTPGKVYT